ncbi:MAG: hypothetical protein IGS03_18405 [Candidatus Sericytochromatia bacterium]|nr:hypothetical protein [Candidatus Sericytochromatia bacterium]
MQARPEVLARSGNKAECHALMAQAGLPILPGLRCQKSDPATLDALQALGLPLLLKPAHGGGGLGIQTVTTAAELAQALAGVLQQDQRFIPAGSTPEVLAERCLNPVRHLEVQLLADGRQHIIALSERDCSLQRRRQKVLEEAPAPGLNQQQRKTLHALACQAGAAVGLDQVATVEFLFDGQDFWFLELNPRLQVEHAVTEAISGEDLVAWQLRLALGEDLQKFSPAVTVHGHAIEARLYAEDPWLGLPAPGQIDTLQLPDGPGLRLELGVYEGMPITSAYDPLLLKLIAWGSDRTQAHQRLQLALQQLQLTGSQGFQSNQAALLNVLQSPAFAGAQLNTHSYEQLLTPHEMPEPLYSLGQTVQKLLAESTPGSARKRAVQPQAYNFWRPAHES